MPRSESVQSRQETEPDCSGLSFCGGSGIAARGGPRRGAPGVVSLAGTQAASCLPVARSLDGHASHSDGLSAVHSPSRKPSGRARPAVSTARAPDPGPASFYTVPCSAALLKPGKLNL